MEKPTNCVNCGAVLTGSVCEYCGTKYGNDVRSLLELEMSAKEVVKACRYGFLDESNRCNRSIGSDFTINSDFTEVHYKGLVFEVFPPNIDVEEKAVFSGDKKLCTKKIFKITLVER